MRKKCKALVAALTAVLLIFGSAVVPASAAGASITINDQPCQTSYTFGYTGTNDAFSVQTDGYRLKINGLLFPAGVQNIILYIFWDEDGTSFEGGKVLNNPGSGNEAASYTGSVDLNALYNFDTQQDGQPLPAGTFKVDFGLMDSEGRFSYLVDGLFKIVSDGSRFGFAEAPYLQNNQSLFNQVNEAPTQSSYLNGFYRSYTASTAFISVEEKAALQQIVAALKQGLAENGVTDDSAAALAAHHFLAAFLYYDYDAFEKEMSNPGMGFAYRTVYEALTSQRTVCEGYAKLFAAMLSLMNIPNRLVYGYAAGQSADESATTENHVWNEVYLNGRWQLFDVTWDSYNNYQVNENGQAEWTYIDGETGEEITTDKALPENALNCQFGSTYADCGMDLFAENHKSLRYLTPKASYKQWTYKNGNRQSPVQTENTEDCYFLAEGPAGGIANGTPDTVEAFGLPGTVKKVTKDGTKEVKVTWLFGEDYQKNYTYNQAQKTAQTVTIYGAADFTESGYKQISITVTVLAAAPAVPVAEKIDKTKVTLKAVENGEYSSDGGKTWQQSPVFENLTPGTEYRFCVRTVDLIGSTPSQPLTVTTLKNYTPGDANEDGVLDLKDAALIARFVANGQSTNGLPTGFYAPAADFNGDGTVNLKDVVALCQSVLNAAA